MIEAESLVGRTGLAAVLILPKCAGVAALPTRNEMTRSSLTYELATTGLRSRFLWLNPELLRYFQIRDQQDMGTRGMFIEAVELLWMPVGD